MLRGTSGIDIDLRRVDINQCHINGSSFNIFGGTDKCKKETTMVGLSTVSSRVLERIGVLFVIIYRVVCPNFRHSARTYYLLIIYKIWIFAGGK